MFFLKKTVLRRYLLAALTPLPCTLVGYPLLGGWVCRENPPMDPEARLECWADERLRLTVCSLPE